MCDSDLLYSNVNLLDRSSLAISEELDPMLFATVKSVRGLFMNARHDVPSIAPVAVWQVSKWSRCLVSPSPDASDSRH